MSDLPHTVRVTSFTFDVEEVIAYPHFIRGDVMHVRLDLPEDHPAVKDAIADGWTIEQAEFVDMIHLQHVRLLDGTPFARSEYARAHAREEESRRMEVVRARVRANRLVLPELDASLQGRYQ